MFNFLFILKTALNDGANRCRGGKTPKIWPQTEETTTSEDLLLELRQQFKC